MFEIECVCGGGGWGGGQHSGRCEKWRLASLQMWFWSKNLLRILPSFLDGVLK